VKFLRVPPATWAKYQHYHDDRDVVWIKLYTSLLDENSDVDYSLLPDASKLLLHHVWMLAARTKNRIPYTKDWVSKKKLNVRSAVNLKPLLAGNFLEIFENDIDGFLVPPLDESLVSHACLVSSLISTSSPKEKRTEEETYDFDLVWSEYPRKRGREKALTHFNAQIKSRADFAALQSAIRNYRRETELLATEEQFVLHGSTFFNARWRDYVDGVWKQPATKQARTAANWKPVTKAE
jgi:hypothetical protein